MQIYAGTSGFSFAEWKGHFYPEGLPDAHMLAFYSARLPTVEINNTFYQMPKPDTVAGWRDGAPDSFLFAVKATRRITHQKRRSARPEARSDSVSVTAISEERSRRAERVLGRAAQRAPRRARVSTSLMVRG